MKALKRSVALLLAMILLWACLPAALAADSSGKIIPSTYSTAPKSSVWKTYKASLHYYYNQLTKKEKMAFSCLYDGIAQGKVEKTILKYFDLTDYEKARVIYAIRYDTPELMFGDTELSGFLPNGYYNCNVITRDDVVTYELNSYSWSDTKLTTHAKKINNWLKKTKTVLNKIKKSKSYGKSAYSHQVALDRYMVKNCKYYDDRKGGKVTTYKYRAAYSVFLTKKAVCEGYARTAMLALRYFGIPCIYVYGQAKGDKGWDGHAWTMVKLGGYWYHYDPTWQDADSSKMISAYFPYFNVTDKVIKRSHTIDKEAKTRYGFKFPTASKTTYEYYTRNKRVLGKDWKNKLAKLIDSAKRAKKTYIGFRFSNISYYNQAHKYVFVSARDNLTTALVRRYSFSASQTRKMRCVADDKSLTMYFYWQ